MTYLDLPLNSCQGSQHYTHTHTMKKIMQSLLFEGSYHIFPRKKQLGILLHNNLMLALHIQFSMPPQNNCHNRPKALNLRKPMALKVYRPRRHCIFWQWNLSEINKLHRQNYWSTLTYVTLWSEPVAISTRSLFRGCQQIIKKGKKTPGFNSD